MPVPTLHYQRLVATLPPMPTIADVLDAIADALDSPTDYLGEVRATPWTAIRDQDAGITIALRLVPPAAEVSDLRVLVAGAAIEFAPPPQLLNGTTYAANVLYQGVCRGVAAEDSWDAWNANPPYAGSLFSGYARIFEATASVVRLYESAETLWIVFSDSNTSAYVAAAGALWALGDSTSETESNGRIYGLVVSGTSPLNANLHTVQTLTAPNGVLFAGGSANGAPMSCAWLGGGVLATNVCAQGFNISVSGSALRGTAGSVVGVPIYSVADASSSAPTLGFVRDVYRTGQFVDGSVIKNSDTLEDLAYIISGSGNSANNSILLPR